MSYQKAVTCMLFVLTGSLGAASVAYARDRQQNLPLVVNPIVEQSALVNQATSLTYRASRLPSGALLEVSGSLPTGLTASLENPREVTYEGTVTMPQSCKLKFRGLKRGQFSKEVTRTLNFTSASTPSVYSGAVSKLDETESHALYQIQATNNSGLPITKAEVVTFISGAAGGQSVSVSIPLPEIAPGEAATATLWLRKEVGLTGSSTVYLIGESPVGQRSYKKKNGTALSLIGGCTYSEAVGSITE